MPLAFPLIAITILLLPAQVGPARQASLAARGAHRRGASRWWFRQWARRSSWPAPTAWLGLAAWDASHPDVFYASFAGGLLLNIAAMVEGVTRYKCNPDANERRRVAVATCTLVLATVAFTIEDGVPAMLRVGGDRSRLPLVGDPGLHLCTALAGVGITYAVAVHRVLAPRVVVRQSLQYALARKTLGLAAALPATLLVVSLIEQRDRSLSEIVSGQPLFYAVLLVLVDRRHSSTGNASARGSIGASSGRSTTRARCCCRCRAASRTRPIPTS